MPDLGLPRDIQREVDRIADQLSGVSPSSESIVHGILRRDPLARTRAEAAGWRLIRTPYQRPNDQTMVPDFSDALGM